MAERTVEIGEVRKNGSSRVKVTVAEYKGKPYADIRTYYLDDRDEWAPTKKGVAFHSVEGLDTAIGLLQTAREKLAAVLVKVAA